MNSQYTDIMKGYLMSLGRIPIRVIFIRLTISESMSLEMPADHRHRNARLNKGPLL